MHRNNLYLLLVAILFVCIFATVLFIFLGLTESASMDVTYKVTNKVAFNAETTGLHFGGGPSGTRITRKIILHSDYPAKYRTTISPELEGILEANWTGTIEKNETIHIPITITIPSREEGNYSGTITTTVIRKII
ncbi:MAG: hypothetical protein ABIA93_04850 [Candidatus Woesearchaeota archaeon]